MENEEKRGARKEHWILYDGISREDDFADREETLEHMVLCDNITDIIIDNMAAAIDISIDDGPIEGRTSGTL